MSSGIGGGASDPGVKPGEILAGKYQVERVLGAGGMGVVVAAHHVQLDEKVALKFLLPEALANAEALARFEREARAAVKIKSEHVARVIDVGKLETGAPYMVMEYLEGGDLSGMLAKTGKLAPEQAVDFVLQASEAIAEAHSLGIVHRDLKPANLFCIRRRDGQLSIKVLDFGISKVTPGGAGGSGSRDMSMTKTTAIVGSPVYMSPEQMQSSKGVDLRTDIWSMGVILYELVTGRVPFNGETVTELAIQIATEPMPSMQGPPPGGLPGGLQEVVSRCLEKQRERRFQNMGELADALAPFGTPKARTSVERIHGMLGTVEGAGRPSALAASVIAPSAQSTGGFAAQPGTGTNAAWQSESTARPGNKAAVGVAIAAGVVLLLAGAGGGLLLLKRAPAPTAPPPAPAVAAPPPVASAALPPSPPASAALVPEPTPAPSASAVAAAPTDAAGTAKPGPARPGPARPATPAPAPAAHCNPPYYFDAQGNRVFKKECL